MTDDELEAVDLAVVAYRLDGEWHVQDLDESAVDSIESIADELRRYPGDDGSLAMLSVDEDFLILVRVDDDGTRVLLSDASAATDWSLARSAMNRIGVHLHDLDEQVPAGDLAIVADLGMAADEMGELLDDFDLFPEEVLSEIADAAGFGQEFDDLVGVDS
jgi:putative tRNA adenosine deaminase-associated protein